MSVSVSDYAAALLLHCWDADCARASHTSPNSTDGSGGLGWVVLACLPACLPRPAHANLGKAKGSTKRRCTLAGPAPGT